MNRLVEFAVVLVLAVIVFIGLGGFGIWEYVHDKLRKERKEDEKDS